MIADPWDGLDRLLERTRSALTPGVDAEAAGPYVGEADDGRVRAEVGPDGRLLSVTIDPDVSRPLMAIGPLVVSAVNAALDACPSRRPDLSVLVTQLREVQEQSAVEMRRITQSLGAALDQTLRQASPEARSGPEGQR